MNPLVTAIWVIAAEAVVVLIVLAIAMRIAQGVP